MDRFVGMHMLHNITNGQPATPISLSGSGGGDEEDEERKLHHAVAPQSPILTQKGKQADNERQELIDKIIAENEQLKAQLGNKVAE